jgi:hypothetical protein
MSSWSLGNPTAGGRVARKVLPQLAISNRISANTSAPYNLLKPSNGNLYFIVLTNNHLVCQQNTEGNGTLASHQIVKFPRRISTNIRSI